MSGSIRVPDFTLALANSLAQDAQELMLMMATLATPREVRVAYDETITARHRHA